MADLTERHWWAILVMAEYAAQGGNMAAYEASIRARLVLRDNFRVNLDDVDLEARDEYLRLLTECEQKQEAEKACWEGTLKKLTEEEREALGLV